MKMTTKPCIKCGARDRYAPRKGRKSGDCRPCAKIYIQEWRENNPEKLDAQKRKRKRNYPEHEVAYNQTWLARERFVDGYDDLLVAYEIDNLLYAMEYINKVSYRELI